ncbi:MAG: HIT domain-containing protein [Bacteroidota bacterium]
MKPCIFCEVVKGTVPSAKVLESEHAYAYLDINPNSRYHTLVIPKRHFVNIFDVEPADMQAVMELTQQVCHLYREKLGIEHIQIITNAGAEAQQTVFHWHVHIVPRKAEDNLDIVWKTHPEWRKDFPEMLAQLRDN